MAMFNSYVKLPEGNQPKWHEVHHDLLFFKMDDANKQWI